VNALTQSHARILPVESRGSISQAAAMTTWGVALISILNAAAIAAFVLGLLLMPLNLHAQNIINTYAGGGAAGGTATSVDLPGPTAAIRDAAGNTYIAAPYSNYIFDLNAGNVTTFAGIGIEGYGCDGCLPSLATLALPSGLATDSLGNIYIAQYGNPRIWKWTKTTGELATVAGTGIRCEPSTNTCGDGGPATNAQFNFPLGVAVDGAGNIYVADAFDNRIRKVTAATGIITTYAGNGVACAKSTEACGDGGSPIGPTLNYPQSVALDSAGNLYIADTRDNRIRMINPTGTTITTVAGNGSTCVPVTKCGDGGLATAANLYMPMSVVVDPPSSLYIADTYGHKIRSVIIGGNISTVAGTGAQGFAGDGSAATSAELNFPTSIFLDGSGNLIVADKGNQRVRQFVSGGNISTIAGGGTGNDGGPALNAILANPFNVAEDASGNLYIADTANNRVRVVNAKTLTITTVAGTGIAGYTGDTGLAINATLDGPTGVAVDAAGDLFIADTGNLVIREVNATTQTITTYAGNGKSCPLGNPTNPCGDNGPATAATFSEPLAITLDSSGNLYIADYNVHRVREVDYTTGIITTIAGLGIAGAGGNGGPATKSHLDHPSGVAVNSAGAVFIDDSYNNSIRCISCPPSGAGVINAYALNGGFTLGGDGGPALKASMWAPMELSLDPAGDLFIGGGNDNVVQRVDAATLTIGTVAGDYAQKGVGGYSGDGGLATAARISNDGLVVDAQGNLYIADAGNNRIRSVQLSPSVGYTPPSNFSSYPIGTTSPAKIVSIASSGGADLSLSNVSFGGNDPQDFAETNTCGTLPALVPVDVTCSISVTFTPVNYGKRTATLVLTDNALNSPQSISLTGFGPYFTVSASPTSLKINPGSDKTTTVSVSPFGQFNQPVNLSCSGLPANTTCSFATNPVTPNGSSSATSVLTVAVGATAPKGTTLITVTGAFGPQGQLQWSTQVQIIIP
jgi:sugar lactone lactonase YvrE